MLTRLLLVIPVLLAAPFVAAAEKPVVKATLDVGPVAPGGRVNAVVGFDIPAGWHLYWINPGESGMAPQLTWRLPRGWTAAEPEFPVPERHVDDGAVTFVYHRRLTLVVELRAPADAAIGPATIGATIDYLVCQDICVPGKTEVSAPVTVAALAIRDPRNAEVLRQANDRLPRPPALAGIQVQAVAQGQAIDLTLAGALPAPPEFPFLPVDEGVFQLTAPQILAADGAGWKLRLILQPQVALPKSLRGLVVGVPGHPGIRIDTPVHPRSTP